MSDVADPYDTLPLSPKTNAELAKDLDFSARCRELATAHSNCEACGMVVKAYHQMYTRPDLGKVWHCECRPTREPASRDRPGPSGSHGGP